MQYHKIKWLESGEPFSELFDDAYFNQNGGLKESQYVFLEGNNLRDRFKHGTGNFVVAETGFGTGLNFLACWQLFEEIANDKMSLDFISVEKYPLSRDQLTQALELWSELNYYSQKLIYHYPDIYNGTIQIVFSKQVTLTLIFDDAYQAYARREQKVDVWFLDGFAPNKNMEMWSEKLFNEIGRLSYSTKKYSTTFATFTAALLVRKNLIRIGFNAKNCKCFGEKREMLLGSFQGQILKYKKTIPAYYSIPQIKSKNVARVAIIGTGLAGCAMAYELSKFGIESDIYEKNSDIAMGASGNEVGIAHPYLSMSGNTADLFFTQGFLQLNQFLMKQENKILFCKQPTITELNNKKSYGYYKDLLSSRNIDTNIARIISAYEASNISGLQINEPMLLYPSAVSVSPKKLCQLWLKLSDKYTTVFYEQQLTNVQKVDLKWHLTFNSGKVREYDNVIFTGGYDQFKNLCLLRNIPVASASGQVDVIHNNNLKCIYINSNYFVPFDNNKLLLGATFRQNNDLSNEFRQRDFNKNLANLPFCIKNRSTALFSRVSTRCTTMDHLPVIGALPNFDLFDNYYKADIKKGTVDSRLKMCPYHQGLYVSSAFGSKGLSGSIISAQIIRSLILKTSLPVCSIIYKDLHPARFQARRYRSGVT